MYYLSQVGLAVSPLSNNSLFLAYNLNPFPKFFKRGLNVSLSTDDPLQFHHTEQPLIEEYATAAQKWELSDGDLSEIARNSILQSGFEHAKKAKWLGTDYLQDGITGNNISYSNVPNIRIQFRADNLRAEKDFLLRSASLDSGALCIPRDMPEQMCRVKLSQPSVDESEQDACLMLQAGIQIKAKYSLPTLSHEERKEGPITTPTPHFFRVMKGVIHVFEGTIVDGKQFISTEPMVHVTDVAPFDSFEDDMVLLVQAVKLPQVQTFANARLRLMDNKFGFHTLFNGALEKELMRTLPTDFAHVTKIDNHVRLQHAMLARHFIKFVREKVKNCGSDVVVTSNGRHVTLSQLYAALGIPIDNLTVDALYVRTDSSLTHLDETSVSGSPSIPNIAAMQAIHARGSPFTNSSKTSDQDLSSSGVAMGENDVTSSGIGLGTGHATMGGTAVEIIIDRGDDAESSASEIAKHLPTRSGSIRLSTRSHRPTSSSHLGSPSLQPSSPVDLSHRVKGPIQHTDSFPDIEAPFARKPSIGPSNASAALWHLYNLFLMSENDIDGRYFAELTKEVLKKRERNPDLCHEFRLIIVGKRRDEWDRLAKWLLKYNLNDHECVQWVVELPATYSYLRRAGFIESLQDYFDNIFMPLLEVTRDPASHPELAQVLPRISGFYVPHMPQQNAEVKVDHMSPVSFTKLDSPPHLYMMYYYWANLYSLNTFRKSKRLHTLALRSSTDANAHSLSKATLFALSSVLHNADLVLRNAPGLTYLCYLTQMGLTVSPLSSNTRAPKHYAESQFVGFFRQGLRVSLSSDNPLQLHMTNEPLNEEYAIASHMWKLTNCDLSEIARNSVVTSGFPAEFKCQRIGHHHTFLGVKGNDPSKTNVPNVRVAFREECLAEELSHIKRSALVSRNASNVDLQSYFAPEQ